MHTNSSQVAPGPGGWIAGFRNLAKLQASPVHFFRNAQREHGDLVRIRLGPFLTHLVTHPEHVRHVLVNNNKNYQRGRFYQNFKLFFGRGILTSDGPAWKQNRAVMQPAFATPRIDGLADMMVAATESLVESWMDKSPENGLETGFDVIPEMMSLTMDVLGQAMFDISLKPHADELGESVETSLRAMFPTGHRDEMIPLWIPTKYNRAVRRAQKRLWARMRAMLGDHRSTKKDAFSIVALMLESSRNGNSKMHDAQIIDEMMTVFLAGHETSGSALAWTLYNVARYPDVQTRLQHEIATVLGGRSVQLKDLPELPYTQMVINESMRLYPPIWLFPREAVSNDTIGGCRIPKGSTVFLCPYLTHRLEEFWEDPLRFNPDRFSVQNTKDREKFAYLPFGGGQRLCIGNHMANLNLMISITTLCQRFQFHRAREWQSSYRTAVSLRPESGLWISAKPRLHDQWHVTANEASTPPAPSTNGEYARCPVQQ